jgi:hypothetical protein
VLGEDQAPFFSIERKGGGGRDEELRSGEASKLGCGAREAFGPLGNCVVSALVTELSAERSRE